MKKKEAERIAAESERIRTKHRAFHFHDGTHSTRITLGDGRTTARRNDSYHAVVFSDEPVPTEPVYYEVEITERETTWSGHIEIGLAAERRRLDNNNLSGMPFDSFYFKPAQSAGTSRTSSSIPLRPTPPAPLGNDDIAAGLRLGLLCADDTITMFVRRASDGYAPRRFGQMDAKFTGGARPYLVINLYGQTRAVRVVPPSA